MRLQLKTDNGARIERIRIILIQRDAIGHLLTLFDRRDRLRLHEPDAVCHHVGAAGGSIGDDDLVGRAACEIEFAQRNPLRVLNGLVHAHGVSAVLVNHDERNPGGAVRRSRPPSEDFILGGFQGWVVGDGARAVTTLGEPGAGSAVGIIQVRRLKPTVVAQCATDGAAEDGRFTLGVGDDLLHRRRRELERIFRYDGEDGGHRTLRRSAVRTVVQGGSDGHGR